MPRHNQRDNHMCPIRRHSRKTPNLERMLSSFVMAVFALTAGGLATGCEEDCAKCCLCACEGHSCFVSARLDTESCSSCQETCSSHCSGNQCPLSYAGPCESTGPTCTCECECDQCQNSVLTRAGIECEGECDTCEAQCPDACSRINCDGVANASGDCAGGRSVDTH